MCYRMLLAFIRICRERFRALHVFSPCISEFVRDGNYQVGIGVGRLHFEEMREFLGDERRR